MTSTLLGAFSRQYKLGLGNRLSLAERHFSGARLGLSTRSFLQRPVLKRTTGLTGLGLALVYSFSPGVLYCDRKHSNCTKVYRYPLRLRSHSLQTNFTCPKESIYACPGFRFGRTITSPTQVISRCLSVIVWYRRWNMCWCVCQERFKDCRVCVRRGICFVTGKHPKHFMQGLALTDPKYLGSQSLIRIDWKRVNSLYENRFYEKDATVGRKAPTVSSAWNWFIHFLTADFPPRATFCAGFLLGLRVG